jgi:hypothetical protein
MTAARAVCLKAYPDTSQFDATVTLGFVSRGFVSGHGFSRAEMADLEEGL